MQVGQVIRGSFGRFLRGSVNRIIRLEGVYFVESLHHLYSSTFKAPNKCLPASISYLR